MGRMAELLLQSLGTGSIPAESLQQDWLSLPHGRHLPDWQEYQGAEHWGPVAQQISPGPPQCAQVSGTVPVSQAVSGAAHAMPVVQQSEPMPAPHRAQVLEVVLHAIFGESAWLQAVPPEQQGPPSCPQPWHMFVALQFREEVRQEGELQQSSPSLPHASLQVPPAQYKLGALPHQLPTGQHCAPL